MPDTKRRARRLVERVRIEEDRGTATDSVGNTVEQWRSIGTTWASVQPVSGREYLMAQQAQSHVTWVVEMWWKGAGTRLTARHRLVWLTGGNRVLYLEPPLIDNQRRWLKVFAMEKS